jgi:hypothetical protein
MNAKTIQALAFAGLFAVAAVAHPTGVWVGDEELDTDTNSSGTGWSYDKTTYTLTLDGAGPFTLSGENTDGEVKVVVPQGVTNAVTLSNLTLMDYNVYEGFCAFALRTDACVSLTIAGNNMLASGPNRAGLEVPQSACLSITQALGDDDAMLEAMGNDGGAGIGGGKGSSGGTVNIFSGTVKATGVYGAGIGGGGGGGGGTVNISGGTVTATGNDGAGIGGGTNGVGGTLTISGGSVTASGYWGGAGIGGGVGGAGGTLTISGGTVKAMGYSGGTDIGPGAECTILGANTFTGGSIGLTNDSISPAPSNNTDWVFCATLTGFKSHAPIEITGLPAYYGTTDIFADNGGAIHLWLPDGHYDFTANARRFVVTIQNGAVHIHGLTGVTVNGEEIAFGSADPAAGWRYNATTCTLSLTNAGPFTISGTNTAGKVRVVVQEGVASAVTLSNLVLRASEEHQCVFALETNAVVSLYLAGESDLTSADYCAGVEVPAGAVLSITNAPDDSAGKLLAYGGGYAAGIGSGFTGAAGTVIVNGGMVGAGGGQYGPGIGCGWGGTAGAVTINGGEVTAVGQQGAAGIGGGYKRSCGTVTITGGIVQSVSLGHGAGIGNAFEASAGGTVEISGGTVTATGGDYAAGIGGGNNGGGCAVEISGGTVTATGGYYGAGIGGGQYRDGCTVEISSGTVTATGGQCGAGIGGGYGGTGGTNIISGGTVAATGGRYGAGIGGGIGGAGGAVTISGGIVTATGSDFYGAGIGGGGGGGGGVVTISGGTVTANGVLLGAGIGSGGYADASSGGDGGTVTITGGSVTAGGGDFAAGIGGGDGDAGGTTTISGGEITATGGQYGAGIGGGNNNGVIEGNTIENAGPGGTVNITGGRVTATGGKCAAGIGGGTGQQVAGSEGAVLTVSGGTVFAIGGAGGAPGIGPGLGNVEEGDTGNLPEASGTSLFTGGSIRIDGGYAAAAPSNSLERVWCVTVTNLTPNAAVVVTALGAYGVVDLFADETGKLYLWLPNDDYAFTAGGFGYTATVAGAAATATRSLPVPVFATDGSAIVVSGTTLSIKITNAQVGAYYTLYWTDTLGGTWNKGPSIQAATGGDLVLTTNIDATASCRFFKVRASETQP